MKMWIDLSVSSLNNKLCQIPLCSIVMTQFEKALLFSVGEKKGSRSS